MWGNSALLSQFFFFFLIFWRYYSNIYFSGCLFLDVLVLWSIYSSARHMPGTVPDTGWAESLVPLNHIRHWLHWLVLHFPQVGCLSQQRIESFWGQELDILMNPCRALPVCQHCSPLYALGTVTLSILESSPELYFHYYLVLQMMKQKHREVKWLAQGHTASQ